MKVVCSIKETGNQDSQVIASDLLILSSFLLKVSKSPYLLFTFSEHLGHWDDKCMHVASSFLLPQIPYFFLAIIILWFKVKWFSGKACSPSLSIRLGWQLCAMLISCVTSGKSLSLCDSSFDKLGQTIYPVHFIRFY